MRKLMIMLLAVWVFQAGSAVVFAGDSGGTVLPPPISSDYTGEKAVANCKDLMNLIETLDTQKRTWVFKQNWDQGIGELASLGATTPNDILACGIKTGGIKLWMIPYYIRYILQFIIGIAGLIAVGGIVYGGYLYLFAGISEDKDKGKKAIMYGVAGMVMTLVAWAFVNIVIAVVTA